MKVKILSDLHVEFHKFDYEYGGEDLVVLAGDIATHNRHECLLDKIKVPTVFVLGNHELYFGSMEGCAYYFTEQEETRDNFYWLHNTWKVIDNVAIFGGMMCTDFSYDNNLGLGKSVAQDFINDFHFSWTTLDHLEEFELFKNRLECFLRATEGMKRIVISHFMPHPAAIGPQYKGSALNSYFCRDMREYMGWEGLWIYGHTHTGSDFMEGDTRVISNPRGYPGERREPYNSQLIVEI
jgi:predicted phosphodiesterase